MEPTGDLGVKAQVEELRSKLLDLTLRNRMLNYRPSKRLGLTVLGEDSLQVLRLLVDEGKKLSFTGKPDPSQKSVDLHAFSDFGDEVSMAELRQAAEDELNAFLEIPAMPVAQMDTKLNTAEYESVLQAKLRTILREAHLAQEELGVNTLFLTLGALEWRETDQRSYRAPLLFVPVKLEQLANGSIRLSHDGSDIGENLPLRAKLKEFGFKLPERDDEETLISYFDEVEATVRKREDWQVHRNAICLAFFNYEKYAMYIDLGGEQWPEQNKPWNAPEVVKILSNGYSAVESPIDDNTMTDDVRPVAKTFEVYDADSSQTIAMIRAADGLSIVVEGPPGTGKSQTITNIIAEAVAARKTVLFVAAKRAALEVVKRRLHDAELGDLCLDLHDKLTNRRAFYAEIKRTVGRRLQLSTDEAKIAQLTDLRARLNAHSADVNTPLEPYGISPFVAMSSLARLPQETEEDRAGRLPFEHLKSLSYDQVRSALPHIRALQARLKDIGVPSKHVYWGIALDFLDPQTKLDLALDLDNAATALLQLIKSFDEVSAQLCVDLPRTFDSVTLLRKCITRASEAPPHDGVAVKLNTWHAEEASIREAADHLRAIAAIRNKWSATLDPGIWTADLSAIRPAILRLSTKWYRSLFSSYRRARESLRSYTKPGSPLLDADLPDLLNDVEVLQGGQSAVSVQDSKLSRLLGVQWQGLNTDPDVVVKLLDWVLGIHGEVTRGQMPSGLLEFLAGSPHLQTCLSAVDQLELTAQDAKRKVDKTADLLKVDKEVFDATAFESQLTKIQLWRNSLSQLPQMISLNESRQNLVRQGCEFLLPLADTWPLAFDRLESCFLRSYFTGVVLQALDQRPALKRFERELHQRLIGEFQVLDDFKLKYNRALVRLEHQRRLPTFDAAAGNLYLLKMQCEKQRGHKSIRWAMSKAGEAIQRIKPVFMMSPLTVAIHLPPELPRFDVVIFDEASQIKPEDALCSIVRANQTIVVGDTRQMPPTSFFDRVLDDDDVDDDVDEAVEMGREARRLESILNLMSAVAQGSVRRPDLRWHYRSIHPKLIQPSNEMFYENRLIVFPSARVEQDGKQIGLVFHHLPDAVYEPGSRKRINRKEAEVIAESVHRHVIHNPTQSLMVAAMNKQQADLIYDEVARREREDPQPFIQFREKHSREPLDVKNLENVQGDERDVVFISITYGRDESGTLRQHFGPLLQEGGERRLNVLISRARMRCEVFSSITADDVRAEPGRAGVYALKQYLSFAAGGRLDVHVLSDKGEDSPFEEEVVNALRSRGYEVDTQVGSEGYRIDIGIRDPDHPGAYLLGVECDGATYHSARSARDRDKLRQRILEDRGWTLHRIWSQDWWQDKEAEIERLVAAIEKQLTAKPSNGGNAQTLEVPQLYAEVIEVLRDERIAIRPYCEAPPFVGYHDADSLAEYAVEVVRVEGPIHQDLLTLRLREALGVARAGSQIRLMVDAILQDLCKASRIQHHSDGYYLGSSQLSIIRDWSERPSSEKKSNYISEIEMAAGLRCVVRESFGIDRELAIREVLRRMGFKASAAALERGLVVVSKMLAAGGLTQKDDQLFAPSPAEHRDATP